jgi:uncharacterized protein
MTATRRDVDHSTGWVLQPVSGTVLDSASFLGQRVSGNLQRLLTVDVEPLLAPFEHRPGSHPWIGEHIGKWMHAATLAWQDTADPELAAKLEDAARRLCAAQEPDGYLGTYEPGVRLGNYPDADWDVWTHKYCMIGLLAYHEASGAPFALDTAVRAADLLISTFGDGPGHRSIVDGAWHMGMAPSSVLQPVVELYRITREERFLEFAQYILRAWDEPGGPRVLSTLRSSGLVSQVGNGKAYEMLSNIIGLLDLGVVTDDTACIAAAVAAWDDVAQHHLYASGTASFGEHFHRPDELPDSVSVNMGEACVTVTWLQLTQRLFGLTGEAKYVEELERTVHNHLSAAQQPDGAGWSYYTPLNGYRGFDGGTSCCISSGPRGMASVPASVAWQGTHSNELVIALYTPGDISIDVPGGRVQLRMDTEMPWAGGARLTFTNTAPVELDLVLRAPAWAREASANGVPAGADGWIRLPLRAYGNEDSVEITFTSGARAIEGRSWNEGRRAFGWGPLVLGHHHQPRPDSAFDYLEDLVHPVLTASAPSQPLVLANDLSGPRASTVLPFAIAADNRESCRVWLPATRPSHELSRFHGAEELQSSGDPRRASFNDYDPWSYAATTDDEQSWFALVLSEPVAFSRVVYVHGRSMVHGGWFDTSSAKPTIQLLAAHGDEWADVGTLEDYPVTDAVHDGGIAPASRCELTLPAGRNGVGLRVVGAGSWGQYPHQRFATCALLQAF